MKPYSIAIDGPSGAGKSTLAKALAEQLGFRYVDTGAIYRTLGLAVARRGKDCASESAVAACLPEIQLSLTYGEDGLQHMHLDGEDVTRAIRENAVSRYASQVSAHPAVRAYLMQLQRDLAQTHSVVMDGRDIGTVVLPEADLKIFLTASVEARAQRRHRELMEKGQDISLAQVTEELQRRDEADTTRAAAPLKQAEDAILADTSTLTLEESLALLRGLVRENLGL